jgi:chaperonin GroES
MEIRKMTVNITPLHDRVLVRRLEQKETAKGGIIIPDTAKEKPQEAEVIAVGAGKLEKGHRVPLDVKAGDRILFGKYTGSEIKIDDQEYLILREEEILVKVGAIAKAASGKK